MTAVKAFIKRHPVLSYFVLAFAISWGGILLIVGGGSGIPASPEQAEMLLPFAVLAMLAGPSVAGILLTGLVHGRVGFRDLFTRMTRWRVGARWYAVALLTAPILAAATLFALSLLSSEFLPGIFVSEDKVALLLVGIAYGLGAGFFEELGWTGFAVPRLRSRYGVLVTGLVVGLVWGAWHWLTNFWGSGTSSGMLALTLFLAAQLFSVAVLPAYRVLMVWAYARTGSLLVAMLMHASLTSIWLILMPVAVSALLVWYLVLAAALWVVVAAVAVVGGGRLSRHSRQTLRKRVV